MRRIRGAGLTGGSGQPREYEGSRCLSLTVAAVARALIPHSMESPAVRRKTMQAVKSEDTGPELRVRRMLHAQGYRYRLHRRDLPGRPDLVFSRRRKIIFVHGCFWHGHDCARGARVPKSNREYWVAKVARNRDRDAKAVEQLIAARWDVLTIWECEMKSLPLLKRRLRSFLERKPTLRSR